MGDDGSIPLQLLVIVFLTFLNAFFASSEIALLSVNDAKIKKMAESGNKKAAHVVSFLNNSSKFLSTIQVGVTFSGFLSSAFAADSFADRLSGFMIEKFPSLIGYAGAINTISVALITLLLSYFTLVFGELVPKRIAMKKTEKLALTAIGPLRFTAIVFAPFVKILTLSVNGVLRLIHINPEDDEEEVTEEEILLMVSEGQEQGIIDDNESKMINNILEFNDLTAEDVMTHRTSLVAISKDASYDEVFKKACDERYSRIPVYETNIDNIIGIIHIKDLLRMRDPDSFDLSRILRPVTFVASTQNIDEVFNILKESSTHLAVVVDEYGGTEGIITMEDILEELVGNIRDEYDEAEEYEHPIVKVKEGEFIISGMAELDTVAEAMEIDLPEDEYDTASGFAIGILGEIPEEGTSPEFEYNGYLFKVLASTEKVINSLKATKIKEKMTSQAAEQEQEDAETPE